MKWMTRKDKKWGYKKWNRIRKQPINRDVQPYWAAAMIAAGGFSAYAGNQGTHGGEWKDTESLRWEWQNGEMSFYGNGSIFSEQHPEISDPEYYLKEAVRYPGEQTRVEYEGRTESKL